MRKVQKEGPGKTFCSLFKYLQFTKRSKFQKTANILENTFGKLISK